MDKICPLLIVGKDRDEIMLTEGLANGKFMCLGDVCASYRFESVVVSMVPGPKGNLLPEEEIVPYCGLAGKFNV